MPPPKGKAIVNTVPRLPPLPKLRVRSPNKALEDPCAGLVTTVLGCWASSGQAAAMCVSLEQQLRACMDKKRPAAPAKNNINAHLGRMYPMFKGPSKKKK